MIAFLRGTILQKGHNFVILETGNVGYQVFINANLLAELKFNEQIEFYIYHNVREDAQELYGFKKFSELEFYKLLISVNGVGPKSALGILGVASIDNIKTSIMRGDPTLLNKVSGIGAKTAERIVLELRNKIDNLAGFDKNEKFGAISSNSDEIDALLTLGYNLAQARDALRQVDTKISKSSARVKEALKYL
ncbi:MAG: Holliday junction branch migration protein RuvA [bacterium]|nr:Holliday junction branch migration protein RuvA [bacterium]